MRLTLEERTAGRLFRDQSQADLLARFHADPPAFEVPHYLGSHRHTCPARNDRSSTLELKEIYLYSPAYDVYEDAAGSFQLAIEADSAEVPDWAGEARVRVTQIPAGRFGFIYRTGRCRGCGRTARSRSGRLVDGWERPPIHGRTTRG